MKKAINFVSINKAVLIFVSLLVLIVAIKLRLDFFNASVTNLPTNTDEALNILMAREIRLGHFPLLFWTQPYQFPLEAYILALFVNFLPPDAFGARVVLSSIACFSVIGFCLVGFLNGRFKDYWILYLLTLIPSSYFITRQVGYLIPQYTTTITFAWLLPVLFLMTKKSKSLIWVHLLGLTAGLALSVHLLSLSIVFMTLLAYCLGNNFKSAIKNSLIILPSLLIGLLPYLLVLLIPNAYEKVADTVGLKEALGRLWDPILTAIMPATMGIKPVIFPDMGHIGGAFGNLVHAYIYLFILILGLSTFISIRKFINNIITKRWVTFDLHDVITGTILITLLMACFAGFGVKYRYILPVAWYFPFLLVQVYMLSKHFAWKLFISVITLTFVYVNYTNINFLIYNWKTRHFAYGIPKLPKLNPLIEYLDSKNIKHCYASWWLVYRIPHETNNRINCVQPYNERFPGWELTPSKILADKENKTPYIFQKNGLSKFNHLSFEEDLRIHNISYDVMSLSQFLVYDNFRVGDSKVVRLLESEYTIESSQNSELVPNLKDRNSKTLWTNDISTTENTSIKINLKSLKTVSSLRLYTPAKHYGTDTRALNFYALVNDRWIPLYDYDKKLKRHLAKVRQHGLRHLLKLGTTDLAGHKQKELTFGFESVKTNSIKIETTNAGNKKPWKISELEVYIIE